MKLFDEAINILLVEDSHTDVILMRKMLSMAKTPNNLYVVKDGIEAIAFLRKEEGYEDVPRPNLILLDLNLPRKNGKEVLAEVKADDNLKTIPIIILSTSDDERDILDCYQGQANCYLTKPISMKDFKQQVELIENFWFNLVQYPQGNED
ncbi:response regulator [Cyanobacterium sp. IPPAS B-1200]|uniref:response regulator n=1 Tax=Cyanobacterium sp. IPPAS B-1200 TaxID=1562720 RepID=UPI000852783E|nr:response regulator [Cyanobacterium sp. IPPAS B-1200]OEJ79807.1 response regulator [Cyanobacterium sp. IPPAS B-1200]